MSDAELLSHIRGRRLNHQAVTVAGVTIEPVFEDWPSRGALGQSRDQGTLPRLVNLSSTPTRWTGRGVTAKTKGEAIRKAEWLAAQHARDVPTAVALPQLQGSPAQIEWAKAIRRDYLVAHADDPLKCARQPRASWWIEKRFAIQSL